MKKSYPLLTLLFSILLLTNILFTGCKGGKNENTVEEPYGIIAQTASGSHVFLSASSLTRGNISALGKGISLKDYGEYFGNFFTSEGYLYTTMPGSGGKLLKNKVTGGGLEKSGEVVLVGLMEDMWYNYHLTSKDTANFFGRSTDARFLTYNQVDLKNMNVLSSGNLPLPTPDTTRDQQYIDHGICIVRDHKLYLTYCYCNRNWQYKDTSFLAVMDYPALTNVKISKYTNIGFPLTYGAVPGAFVSQSGEIQMTGGINDYEGVKLPSGIHKIAKDSNTFIESINAKEKLGAGYALYGIWDLGNGKVLTRVAGPWFDQWVSGDNTYDLYTADLATGAFAKLDIPRSVHLGNSILVKDGSVYIANSTAKCIYTYDIASGSITKGLTIQDVKGLVGIYPLN